MQIGMIGLGKMGANMVRRLMRGGHECVVFDLDQENVKILADEGATGVSSMEELVKNLRKPRSVWIMVPSGNPTDKAVLNLANMMEPGDVIIDGGNSYYKDDMRRSEELKKMNLHYIDVGTSGGVWGLDEGYSIMVGGDKEVVERLRPIFSTLAPAVDKGWGYVGPSGAGHFVKMIHNGIEYGLMQAYAEGFELMQHKEEFKLDLRSIAEIWQFGSVVRSWCLGAGFR
jgi:6-phosphogluconate dehydrogenase